MLSLKNGLMQMNKNLQKHFKFLKVINKKYLNIIVKILKNRYNKV